MSSLSDDPYFLFKDDLLHKLQVVDETLENLKRLAQDQQHQSSSPSNNNKQGVGLLSGGSAAAAAAKFKQVRKELKKHFKSAESTLKDLETAVSLMERQPTTTEEQSRDLYDRRGTANACKSRLSAARTCFNMMVPAAPTTPGSGGHHSSSSLLHSDDASTSLLSAASSNTNDHHHHHHNDTRAAAASSSSSSSSNQVQASLLMQHQDECLDELDAAVVRVGYMAENIHEEIDSQNKVMDEMSSDLVEAEEQLGAVMGKLSDFLGTKDRFQLCTIVGLFFVAIVLVLLVVYS